MFVWVWEIKKIVKRYGGIDKLIQKLKELGINNLCIKFHEGASAKGDGVDFREDFLKYKDILKENGFTVGAWGYNYFNNISREVAFISEALKKADYYIFDPEREVKNKKSQAEDVCSIIRDLYPGEKIGYSSYAIPSYHRELPFEVFDKYCDFFSPQTYFQEMDWDVQKCLDKMHSDVREMKLKSKVIPSIQGYNQQESIYKEFQEKDYPEFGIWSLDFLDKEAQSWLRDLKVNRENTDSIDEKSVVNKLFDAIKEIEEQEVSINDLESVLQYFSDKPLRIGDKNKLVEILQLSLMKRGISLDIFGADGDFGYETSKAVSEFQESRGLKADSIVGIKTWGEIIKEEGRK